MITLLAKDFKLMFVREKSITKRILIILMTIFFLACFIGIEVFLFSTILNKIGNFYQASMSFMTLFLFIISIIIIISGIFRAIRLFFNEKDIEQLTTRPVSNSSIIFSKLFFLFITHYVISILFVYPLFISYGIEYSMTLKFYYLALFYPLLTFFFEMGVALLLIYPFWLLKNYLNKHLLLRFFLVLIVLFIGCYFYAKVLNLFIEIIAGGNINNLFTQTIMDKLVAFRKYEVPISFLTDIFIQNRYFSVLPYLAIAIGIFILGLSITIFTFGSVRNVYIVNKKKIHLKSYQKVSVKKALVQKEITLLTKNKDYILSFIGLLIIQPFLAYLVIKSLNTIFTSGIFAYYITVVPSFLPLLDILILMLFSVIISQGASQYIQMEKKTIKVMKTIPVAPKVQLMIKVCIPLLLSLISLLVTLVVLLVFKIITFITFIFALTMVSILLIIYDAISLKEELSIRNHKPRKTFISSIFSYVLPIVYFVVTALLSYFGMSIHICYTIGLVIFILFGIPYTLILNKKMDSLFMDLDVIN